MGCSPAPPLGPVVLWVTRSQLIGTQHSLSFLEVTTLAQMGRGTGLWARLTMTAAAWQRCVRT